MPLWPKRNSRQGIEEYGRSPLWNSAANGDVSAIEQQVGLGENPSCADDAGLTPLHIAAQNGLLEVIDLLIRLKADANAVDKYGNGPLWTATHNACLATAGQRNFSIVKALLAAGANPLHRNKHNRSPFEISERRSEVREIFASAGVLDA